mgnify:CR=1 FL=1
MHAMDLLKKYGIIFGTSICYTRQNIEAVTNDAFMRLLCEKGAHFGFYFHYMPVGNEAAPELMPTPEQRKYMIDRIRYLRSSECDIPFYPHGLPERRRVRGRLHRRRPQLLPHQLCR